jgi:hypothetical protein
MSNLLKSLTLAGGILLLQGCVSDRGSQKAPPKKAKTSEVQEVLDEVQIFESKNEPIEGGGLPYEFAADELTGLEELDESEVMEVKNRFPAYVIAGSLLAAITVVILGRHARKVNAQALLKQKQKVADTIGNAAGLNGAKINAASTSVDDALDVIRATRLNELRLRGGQLPGAQLPTVTFLNALTDPAAFKAGKSADELMTGLAPLIRSGDEAGIEKLIRESDVYTNPDAVLTSWKDIVRVKNSLGSQVLNSTSRRISLLELERLSKGNLEELKRLGKLHYGTSGITSSDINRLMGATNIDEVLTALTSAHAKLRRHQTSLQGFSNPRLLQAKASLTAASDTRQTTAAVSALRKEFLMAFRTQAAQGSVVHVNASTGAVMNVDVYSDGLEFLSRQLDIHPTQIREMLTETISAENAEKIKEGLLEITTSTEGLSKALSAAPLPGGPLRGALERLNVGLSTQTRFGAELTNSVVADSVEGFSSFAKANSQNPNVRQAIPFFGSLAPYQERMGVAQERSEQIGRTVRGIAGDQSKFQQLKSAFEGAQQGIQRRLQEVLAKFQS